MALQISVHGRQEVRDFSGRVLFSVAKLSRIKTMSLRHNLEVNIGENKDEVRGRLVLPRSQPAPWIETCAKRAVQSHWEVRGKLI